MQITLHAISLVILFGATICLPLTMLLWMVPWGNRRANQCLSLMLASTCAVAIAIVPIVEGIPVDWKYYLILPLQLLPAPLLYFYTRILTQPQFRWQPRHAWHLAPAVATALLWLLQQPLSPEAMLNQPCPTSGDCDLFYRSRLIHRCMTFASIIGYSVTALWVLRPHLQRIKESYSAIEEVNLRWLETLLYVLLLATAVAITIEARGFVISPHEMRAGSVMALLPLMLSLLLGWFGLQQRRILVCDTPATQPAVNLSQKPCRAIDVADKKYQTSSLTDEGAAAIWQRLQRVMSTDKPHLEAGLKIADLAGLLDIPVHHLSETINGFAHQSFYDFINQHRVDEAARLLTDDTKSYLSVTDIGLQAGFNSNSTFFTHFKKRLQQTPRQYRQQHESAVTN